MLLHSSLLAVLATLSLSLSVRVTTAIPNQRAAWSPTSAMMKQAVAPQVVFEAQPGSPEFEKYRPDFHFQPERFWMNDPCAPMYVPETGLYHLFFQYSPYSSAWGNMTWGHAVSKDMIFWTDLPTAINPTNSLDYLGVFSGGAWTSGVNNQPTIFYTGVNNLPLGWAIPYDYGTEKVAMATSPDNGVTWIKNETAVIDGPPKGVNFTGWRDPFIFKSPEIDALLGIGNGGKNASGETVHYMTVSGGEREKGGRLFLYWTVDWFNWNYEGIFFRSSREPIDVALDGSSREWTGSFGANFEMSNYFTLTDDSNTRHHFALIGTEGGRGQTKDDHWPLWVSGDITKTPQGQVELTSKYRGIGDAGPEYASNSFFDTKSGRHIMYGWMRETNGNTPGAAQPQGWAGAMTIPRELFVMTVKNVVDVADRLKTLGPFMVSDGVKTAGGQDTKIVKTLGVRPIPEVETARSKEFYTYAPPPPTTADDSANSTNVTDEDARIELLPVSGKSYEIYAEAKTVPKYGRVGFVLRHDERRAEETLVYYDDKRGRVVVDRTKNSANSVVNKEEDSGKFELFDLACDSSTSFSSSTSNSNSSSICTQREPLTLRIFVDNSVIEVYANDRFALSSRIYPEDNDAAVKMSVYAMGRGAGIEHMKIYSEFKNVFLERSSGRNGTTNEKPAVDDLASNDASSGCTVYATMFSRAFAFTFAFTGLLTTTLWV